MEEPKVYHVVVQILALDGYLIGKAFSGAAPSLNAFKNVYAFTYAELMQYSTPLKLIEGITHYQFHSPSGKAISTKEVNQHCLEMAANFLSDIRNAGRVDVQRLYSYLLIDDGEPYADVSFHIQQPTG